jgi:hypothetical protein
MAADPSRAPEAEVRALEQALKEVIAAKYGHEAAEERSVVDFQIVHHATHLGCNYAPNVRDIRALPRREQEAEVNRYRVNAEVALDLLAHLNDQLFSSTRRRPR